MATDGTAAHSASAAMGDLRSLKLSLRDFGSSIMSTLPKVKIPSELMPKVEIVPPTGVAKALSAIGANAADVLAGMVRKTEIGRSLTRAASKTRDTLIAAVREARRRTAEWLQRVARPPKQHAFKIEQAGVARTGPKVDLDDAAQPPQRLRDVAALLAAPRPGPAAGVLTPVAA